MAYESDFDEFDDHLELAIESKTARLSLNEIRKRKRAERILIAFLFAFLLGIGAVAWFTEGAVFTSAWDTLQRLDAGPGNGSKNIAANCRDPRNKNTPFCVERAAREKSDWQEISRYEGGKANAFTLHGK